MPKMYHAIEGQVRPTRPGPPARVMLARPAPVIDGRFPRGLWKYPAVRRTPETLWLAIFISINLHLLAIYGLSIRPDPPKVVAQSLAPEIQLEMPDIKDLEEEKPVETLIDEEALPDPGIYVPSLADSYTLVTVDTFVQPLEYHPPAPTDLSGLKLTTVPIRISRGRAAADKLGKVFDLSQLDRIPEALVQLPPVFPSNLKRETPAAEVTVGFVVNAKGDVVVPYVVQSSHHGFEQAALAGVEKWKFRPGVKGGRKVNTRMQVEIRFRVADEK